MDDQTGIIFNIQKFSVHDGPGIRTTVFMKGCPLRCRWCSNAESMNPSPELGIIHAHCNNCGKCLEVCPEKAIGYDSAGNISINRDDCTSCGDCVSVCAPGALTVYGNYVTVDEVVAQVGRDSAFYQGSGGGVTVSGGEPLRQADFVAELFKKCRKSEINTCLDTCGYTDESVLAEILGLVDKVLFDIKHMNPEEHKKLTGVSNDLILKNARVVAESGASVLFRIPLVKGINDTADNIEKTALFVKELGSAAAVELLPYHRLGIGKYDTLDRAYPGYDLSAPSPEEVKAVIQMFEDRGVSCTAGG